MDIITHSEIGAMLAVDISKAININAFILKGAGVKNLKLVWRSLKHYEDILTLFGHKDTKKRS
jgi:butyrate kinase